MAARPTGGKAAPSGLLCLAISADDSGGDLQCRCGGSSTVPARRIESARALLHRAAHARGAIGVACATPCGRLLPPPPPSPPLFGPAATGCDPRPGSVAPAPRRPADTLPDHERALPAAGARARDAPLRSACATRAHARGATTDLRPTARAVHRRAQVPHARRARTVDAAEAPDPAPRRVEAHRAWACAAAADLSRGAFATHKKNRPTCVLWF